MRTTFLLGLLSFQLACSDHLEADIPEVVNVRQGLSLVDVRAKDLAIAFALNGDYLVRADERLANGQVPLPRSWYADIEDAFRGTSAEDALDYENYYEDWKLVSARVAPCSPLASSIASDNTVLCWPELRLVWQPILYKVRAHARFSPAFADDRAVHALYDVSAEPALSSGEASRARNHVANIRAGQALSPSQRADLVRLRNLVVADFMQAALALRDPRMSPDAYTGLGLRPETVQGGLHERALRDRMLGFLRRYSPPQQLRELTAFSLPAGREPAHLDEWVFVAFAAKDGRLMPKDIVLTDHATGETRFNYGPTMTASQSSDDTRVYAALNATLDSRVILDVDDIERLGPTLADRTQTLIPHTSCASCHKLNDLRFDFHNFGYLEDRELTISPRVHNDVALDLSWLSSRSNP